MKLSINLDHTGSHSLDLEADDAAAQLSSIIKKEKEAAVAAALKEHGIEPDTERGAGGGASSAGDEIAGVYGDAIV